MILHHIANFLQFKLIAYLQSNKIPNKSLVMKLLDCQLQYL